MDLVICLVRSSIISSTRQNSSYLRSIKQRLIHELGRDPVGSRTLAYHAAQIVGRTHGFLVSAPCEILRIFMGFSFLLAYVAYGRRVPSGTGIATLQALIYLDATCMTEDQQGSLQHWLRNDGPAAITVSGDIDNQHFTKLLRQQAQDTLRRLDQWGLADHFSKMMAEYELA
jgi:hypothetical protein